MKFELKDFQIDSARAVLDELTEARAAVAKGKPQAVVLNAPTGSGKTIAIAAVIDWMLGGTEGFAPRPQTTFLWLSDSPELNVQSKNKLVAACEQVPFHRLTTVDSDQFDEERLTAGQVYFINTQLLGKDKLLTQTGNRRGFTFWQTVANTVAAAPQDFVLIIDEAHRGASVTDKARKPIMQKFVTGSEIDNLPPVQLILGMSATPLRFTELLGTASRTQRPINIPPEAVRQSGLLKDLIVVLSPQKSSVTDLTLLEDAAKSWKLFEGRWSAYCAAEREKEHVRPILVVQVEDGTDKTITRSPLAEIVHVLERQMGSLGPNEIVHCFQEKDDLQYGGRIIRRIEASRIQDASDIRVVLFKTALTTGWDCPRAEVMMSFRRAQDPTSIAQLVGRMIRTPLARRIEKDELLNTVSLYLPHYDTKALEVVLARLRNPDEHDAPPTEVATKATAYAVNPAFADVHRFLQTLPTYTVRKAPARGDVKRVLRLASLLVHDGIDAAADEKIREILIKKIKQHLDLVASKPEWQATVSAGGNIDVDVTTISTSSMVVSDRHTSTMKLSPENIDQLFDEAGRRLAAGEGLHRTYWKRYHDRGNPFGAKLELFALSRLPEMQRALEELAREQFERLWLEHKDAIKKQSAADRVRFQHLAQASGKSTMHDWELPDQIVVPAAQTVWQQHLYSDEKGNFSTDLNTWETRFLMGAMKQPDFVCWVRNLPRRDWAFAIPYDHQGEKPFFPDFLIIRRKGMGFEADIIEPHDATRTDTWAKVKGLARFADEEHLSFGMMIIGRIKEGEMQTIDVAEPRTREQARKIGAPADLEVLFGQA